jgi:hypothetical protein
VKSPKTQAGSEGASRRTTVCSEWDSHHRHRLARDPADQEAPDYRLARCHDLLEPGAIRHRGWSPGQLGDAGKSAAVGGDSNHALEFGVFRRDLAEEFFYLIDLALLDRRVLSQDAQKPRYFSKQKLHLTSRLPT